MTDVRREVYRASMSHQRYLNTLACIRARLNIIAETGSPFSEILKLHFDFRVYVKVATEMLASVSSRKCHAKFTEASWLVKCTTAADMHELMK